MLDFPYQAHVKFVYIFSQDPILDLMSQESSFKIYDKFHIINYLSTLLSIGPLGGTQMTYKSS